MKLFKKIKATLISSVPLKKALFSTNGLKYTFVQMLLILPKKLGLTGSRYRPPQIYQTYLRGKGRKSAHSNTIQSFLNGLIPLHVEEPGGIYVRPKGTQVSLLFFSYLLCLQMKPGLAYSKLWFSNSRRSKSRLNVLLSNVRCE